MNLLRLVASTAIVINLGAVALACSSDPETKTEAAACAEYASAYLGWVAKCGGSLSDAGQQHVEARRAQYCTSLLSLPGVAATSDDMMDCARVYRSASCATTGSAAPKCNFKNGTLADGAACVTDEQCVSGSCETMPGSSCGACEPRTAIGGACSITAPCASGLTCSTTTMTCVEIVRNGPGGSCDWTEGQICEPGLDCEPTSKTCKERGAAGAACSSIAPCASGLTCSAMSRTCVEVTILREGEACDATSEAQCGVGLTCDPATRRCVGFAWVGPGGDCSAFGARCERGTCDRDTKTCPAVIADGQACGDPNAGVCDYFASCIDGKCQMVGSVVCK